MQNIVNSSDLEHSISQLSINTVLAGSVILTVLVLLGIWTVRKNKNRLKKPLYILIASVITLVTLIISGATIYLNLNSDTGGPVHWHADIEFWACGNELELRDPQGALSNKIGTATLHEHNDKRIHLEGVPVSLPKDASLSKFMDVVGGKINSDNLVVPLNNDDLFEDGHDEQDGDGPAAYNPSLINPFIYADGEKQKAVFSNEQSCGDQPSYVQVFAYNFNEESKTYTQTKLSDPANYAVSRHSEVPPGDCVIFEFGPMRDKTDKLCEQYGIRDIDRCAQFGVESGKVCDIKEID